MCGVGGGGAAEGGGRAGLFRRWPGGDGAVERRAGVDEQMQCHGGGSCGGACKGVSGMGALWEVTAENAVFWEQRLALKRIVHRRSRTHSDLGQAGGNA